MSIRSASRLAAVAVAVGAASLLGACASGTGYHYSQLYGERYYKAPIHTYAVTIIRVDGRDDTFRPVLVDPGLRQVTVQGPPGGTRTIGEQRTIALEVAPCTRYYLVAVKPNELDNDFTVEIDHREPVSGCTPPNRSS